ncbi:hypothetical protein QVD17_19689 [Tagetes erecta]|uniref:Uncharacterized protein n=1 Tax=Tagetes erecta TaxID=13708 RepID=A0AAD8KRE9_TARER|nr:hypothetical protein QVD17_19689 [Tagetes erecta]
MSDNLHNTDSILPNTIFSLLEDDSIYTATVRYLRRDVYSGRRWVLLTIAYRWYVARFMVGHCIPILLMHGGDGHRSVLDFIFGIEMNVQIPIYLRFQDVTDPFNVKKGMIMQTVVLWRCRFRWGRVGLSTCNLCCSRLQNISELAILFSNPDCFAATRAIEFSNFTAEN